MRLVASRRAKRLLLSNGYRAQAVISKINRVSMEMTLTRRKEDSDLDQFDEGSYQFLINVI